MLAFGGAPGSRLNVSVLPGMSGSLATLVIVKVCCSIIVRFEIVVITGGKLLSSTVTEKVLASLNGGEPLSVTRTVMLLTPGPCASVGVHVNTPLVGLMLALGGAPGSRLNVSVLPGTSGSFATLVIV